MQNAEKRIIRFGYDVYSFFNLKGFTHTKANKHFTLEL